MKVKIDGKEIIVVLFNEDHQSFHNSYLGWDCASENYGVGWRVISYAEADSKEAIITREFSTYYRSLNTAYSIGRVKSLVEDYINENI
tara:strand:- start:106 stop:369 length:264 start_codon:yes stop_codon:yes gene_type:complete